MQLFYNPDIDETTKSFSFDKEETTLSAEIKTLLIKNMIAFLKNSADS